METETDGFQRAMEDRIRSKAQPEVQREAKMSGTDVLLRFGCAAALR